MSFLIKIEITENIGTIEVEKEKYKDEK